MKYKSVDEFLVDIKEGYSVKRFITESAKKYIEYLITGNFKEDLANMKEDIINNLSINLPEETLNNAMKAIRSF